jgi:hypothetical protein
MKKAKPVNRVRKRKKPGPPRTTGPGTLVGIRCHKEFLEKVDAWREMQAEPTTRPQAILRLATLGLVRL